jgi:tRNA(Ile2)-agmatinylcytidine synthase
MVLWIGVDDTDSVRGMCTTFLASELIRELTKVYDLIGYPRLVRLNPNILWKTRGNGAVCIRVGRGMGQEKVVGELEGRPILSFPHARGGEDSSAALEIVARSTERWSELHDPSTNPGFAVLPRPTAAWLYWRAVRQVVSKEEALKAVVSPGVVKEYKNGRGIIGALAATSWRPRDRTYEVLCYRALARWGTPRQLDPTSVRNMDWQFPTTFNNYDYDANRIVIAPHSPCPILFGIRGDDPVILPDAMRMIRGERPEGWLIFETNQGTGDHVARHSVPLPRTTVRLEGEVTKPPRTLHGGHVVFQVDGLDVTAYEPSKSFRQRVLGLVQGDRVSVVGSIRDTPRTLNLELFEVISLAASLRKSGNPFCPRCRKRAKSMGRSGGYRCARCSHRLPSTAAPMEPAPRSIQPGWYEPPVGSMRHLAKPLRRGPARP